MSQRSLCLFPLHRPSDPVGRVRGWGLAFACPSPTAEPCHCELQEAISPPAFLQVQCPFTKAGVFAEVPTMDSDPGAAGCLSQGILSQTRVGAIVLRQSVLDVELRHPGVAGGVSILDGLLCGGKHSKAQAGEHCGWACEPFISTAAVVLMLMLTVLPQIP